MVITVNSIGSFVGVFRKEDKTLIDNNFIKFEEAILGKHSKIKLPYWYILDVFIICSKWREKKLDPGIEGEAVNTEAF